MLKMCVYHYHMQM